MTASPSFGGIGRALPMTVFAFGLGGLSLMGLPPSGGFAAKWLLLQASVESGQWWWAVVMLAGGLLAGGYVFRVLAPALASASVAVTSAGVARVARRWRWRSRSARCCSASRRQTSSTLLQIGRPAGRWSALQ